MSAANRSSSPLTEMPAELRDRLDAMVVEYCAIREKENRLRVRQEAVIGPLRVAMGELINKYHVRLERLIGRRNAITRDVLAIWARHLSGEKKLVVPKARISRRHDIAVDVVDKRKAADALDRLDRLDVVDEVIDMKKLAALAREGLLDSVPADAIRVSKVEKIQVVVKGR